MPIALLVIGLILLITAVRGTAKEFLALISSAFSGRNNFIMWFAAIIAVGSLGYVKTLKPLANSILALLIIVLLLSNRGFFGQNGFVYQLRNHTVVPAKSLSQMDKEGGFNSPFTDIFKLF